MRKDDEIRIRHMLDAAREAEAFAAGRTRRDLDTDRQLVLSLVKEIEIVGEAATRSDPPRRRGGELAALISAIDAGDAARLAKHGGPQAALDRYAALEGVGGARSLKGDAPHGTPCIESWSVWRSKRVQRD